MQVEEEGFKTKMIKKMNSSKDIGCMKSYIYIYIVK